MKYKNPAFDDRLKLGYCYGGTVIYEPGEVLGPRLLTDFEAVLIIDGFPEYEAEGRFQTLEPGSMMIARPGTTETYRWDTQSRTRHAYLHFKLDAIPQDWPLPAEWPRLIVSPPPILGQLFHHIADEAFRQSDWPARKPGPLYNRLFETFLDLYLNTAEQNPAAPSRILSEPVRRAAKLMRERLDSPNFESFTLDQLAAAAHVSAKHLCRVFTHELGVPPMKACRMMQFQLAIPLLARSNLSIKEIAERCGFPDQLYFSRTFSQTFGNSPSTVRKALRAGEPPPVIPLPAALMPRMFW